MTKGGHKMLAISRKFAWIAALGALLPALACAQGVPASIPTRS